MSKRGKGNLRVQRKRIAKEEQSESSSSDEEVSSRHFVVSPTTPLRHIVRHIEQMKLLLPPVGCGPIAETNWIKLGTSDLIIAMRDELQMNKNGVTIGDRTWRRCKMRAETEIQRYESLNEEARIRCDKAGIKGIEDPGKSPTYILQVGDEEKERKTKTFIRCPKYAIMKAFAPILDKCWHRYMFPFGCYFLDRGSNTESTSEVWRDWASDLIQNNNLAMNPYSVTSSDILYLCNVRGYLDRMLYILVVLEWAKERGVNLLIHRRMRNSDESSFFSEDEISPAEQYISAEKHIFVFGSIQNHLETITNNYNFVGGYWDEKIRQLRKLYDSLQVKFRLTPGSLDTEFETFLIKDTVAQARTDLTLVFKKCSLVGERRS